MESNPPIKIPANLTSASPTEVFVAIAANINDKDIAEGTQRNYVIRCLAALGHGRSPDIHTGQMDGSRVRLYVWHETPIGNVVLVTGPSWRGKLVKAEDVEGSPETGFWFAATPDRSKALARVDEYRERMTTATAEAARRAIARDAAQAAKPARAPPAAAFGEAPVRATRAVHAPVDTGADERAELRAGIDSLAALLR